MISDAGLHVRVEENIARFQIAVHKRTPAFGVQVLQPFGNFQGDFEPHNPVERAVHLVALKQDGLETAWGMYSITRAFD